MKIGINFQGIMIISGLVAVCISYIFAAMLFLVDILGILQIPYEAPLSLFLVSTILLFIIFLILAINYFSRR